MKQNDKDLLTEAYKIVQKNQLKEDDMASDSVEEAKKPIMTQKAPEVPKESERTEDTNPVRGWFAVYVSGPDEAACESVAAKLKEFLATISETYPGCIIDTDQGGLEFDPITEDDSEQTIPDMEVQEAAQPSFFVVDRVRNDKWLKQDCKGYDYTNRPWAKGFTSKDAAFDYANKNTPERLDVEFPDGKVMALVKGKWEVTFT